VAGQLVVAWPRGRPAGDVDMEALGRLTGLAALAVRHRRLAVALLGGRDFGSVRAGTSFARLDSSAASSMRPRTGS
jgi:hypothetical protein